MRISGFETFIVGNPWKNWVFLVLETDEGAEGVGEATVHLAARATEALAHELSRFYVGRDPFEVDSIRRAIAREGRVGPIHAAVLAAIEMACLDIQGKVEGKPVWALLGREGAERVALYANGWYQGPRCPENFAEKAREVARRGYRALKFDPFGAAFGRMTSRQIDRSLEIIAAVREAVGDSVDICIEGHWRFSPDQAVVVAREMRPFRPLWFGEPVPSEQIEQLRWVRERVEVPLATGEHLLSPLEFRRLLEAEACDIIQPDILHVGGFGPMLEIARMAEEKGVRVAPHQSEGPVASVANVHLASVLPRLFLLETFDEFAVPWRDQLLSHPVEISDGQAVVPRRPGLGTTFNRDAALRHPYDPAAYLALFEEGWESRRLGMQSET